MIEVFSDLTKLNKLSVLLLAITKLLAIAGIVVGFSTDARYVASGLFAIAALAILTAIVLTIVQMFKEGESYDREEILLRESLRLQNRCSVLKDELKSLEEQKMFKQHLYSKFIG